MVAKPSMWAAGPKGKGLDLHQVTIQIVRQDV